MPAKNTRAITEGGMVVGITVILSLLGMYVPIISAVAMLVWVVPIAYLGVRRGMRWSIMATVATVFILTTLTGPLAATMVGMLLGTMAIVLGEGFRQKWSASRLLMVTTLIFLLGFVVEYTLVLSVMGVNIIDSYFQMWTQSYDGAYQVLSGVGMNEVQLAQSKNLFADQLLQLRKLVPFLVVFSGLTFSYLEILVTRLTLKRLQVEVPKFSPAAEWEMPRITLYIYVVAMLVEYFGASYHPWIVTAAMNIKVACMYIILIQGVAVLFWAARKYPMVHAVKWIILVGAFFMPPLLTILFLIGLFDMGIGYRKKKGYQ